MGLLRLKNLRMPAWLYLRSHAEYRGYFKTCGYSCRPRGDKAAPLGVDRVYRRCGVILVGISFLPLDYDRLAYERGGAVSCMGYARHVFFVFNHSEALQLVLRAGAAESVRV